MDRAHAEGPAEDRPGAPAAEASAEPEGERLPANDHRAIGRRLRLFHLQEEAPGMVFWHPRGFLLLRLLEAEVRRRMERDGYQEIRTPQMLERAIWQASGHWEHYAPHMFQIAGHDDRDGRFALKPVNCPAHVQLVKRWKPSWRELPLRLSEFGCCHRDEPSGSVLGLMRLRQFTQDDGHVFCDERHVEDEVAAFFRSLVAFYRALGFQEIGAAFADRPPNRAGDDTLWDRAEAVLRAAAARTGLVYEDHPGEGAFYGPKLEFVLRDRRGRSWQCGTIQLDLVLPQRFDLRYAAADGTLRRPVMLHRAMLGSLERFLAVLLEHHEGALPPWLCPEQARVLPVGAAHAAHAARVQGALAAAGVRAAVDASAETVGKRALRARQEEVPFLLVVGDREAADAAVSLRGRGAPPVSLPLVGVVARVGGACAPPPLA
jgi:threonyl-tRNA synthetase